jgi:hypothetical protein
MPEVSFATVSRLFNEKATDRIQKTVNAAGNTDVVPALSLGRSASAIAPTTTRTQTIDGLRMRGPYAGALNGDERIGFVLTSELWADEGRAIALHAGPNQASWELALRASDEPTKAGHARFAQARVATGAQTTTTWFDNPKVRFEFQTGNIMPIPLLLDEVAVPYGLDDFYLFMELLNQPPLVPSGPHEGKHNYVWIFYTSLQFPNLVLRGYFEPEGLSWSDSADSPTSTTWSSGFIVHDMSPNLWERNELKDAYTFFMKQNIRLL